MNAPALHDQAQHLADASITLVKDDPAQVPLDVRRIGSAHLIVVSPRPSPNAAADLEGHLGSRLDSLEVDRLSPEATPSLLNQAKCRAANADLCVVALHVPLVTGTGRLGLPLLLTDWLKELVRVKPSALLISLGDPYLIRQLSFFPTYLCAYSHVSTSQRAAARAIFGEIPLAGKLPVSIPGVAAGDTGLPREALPMVLEKGASGCVQPVSKGNPHPAQPAATDHPALYRTKGLPGSLAGRGLPGEAAGAPRLRQAGLHFEQSPGKPAIHLRPRLAHQGRVHHHPGHAGLRTRRDRPGGPARTLLSGVSGGRASSRSRSSTCWPIPPAFPPMSLSTGKPTEKRTSCNGFWNFLWNTDPAVGASTATWASFCWGPSSREHWETASTTWLENGSSSPWECAGPASDPLPPGGRASRPLKWTRGGSGCSGARFTTKTPTPWVAWLPTRACSARPRTWRVFCQTLLNGGVYNHGRIVKRSALETFTRRQAQPSGSSRALGWDTPAPDCSAGSRLSPRSYGHTGFTGTSLWIDPRRRLFIVFLTNRVHPSREDSPIQSARRQIADTVAEAVDQWEIMHTEIAGSEGT